MEGAIKELWVLNSEKEEYEAVVVLSTYKASFSRSENPIDASGSSIGVMQVSSEQIMALCYYPETGEIIEYPLNECIIKELNYGTKESGKSVSFSKPDFESEERRENR